MAREHYTKGANVTTEYNKNRLYGPIPMGVLETNGSRILIPWEMTGSGLKVDIGDSVNINIGSVIGENVVEIKDGDSDNRWDIDSDGAGLVKQKKAPDYYTTGSAYVDVTSAGSTFVFPRTLCTFNLITGSDIYIRFNGAGNPEYLVEALEREFALDGLDMTEIRVRAVGSPAPIKMFAF